jgi:hypothetical protein
MAFVNLALAKLGRAGVARTFPFVIAGLDSAIHAATSLIQFRRMA